jgi:S-formylglutathione hydrolase
MTARILLVCLSAASALAQSTVIDVSIHSPGLEHNLLGDSPDQKVSIYLPDAYAKQPEQRFPVLFFLHGFSDPTPRHEAAVQMQEAMDKLIANRAAEPMIIVLPNGLNKYYGAFYANSAVNGNWEDYIVQELVAYVDSHYRTLPKRAIAGHSMGGYGALTLAFRHPDVFGSVYAMSPCCTDLAGDMGPSNPAWTQIGKLDSPDQVPAALQHGQFFVAAFSAMDAALAPDPKAKIFGDAPFYLEGGDVKTNASAYTRIASKMPVHMVGPLLSNIQKLQGIFIEYGAQENFTHIVIGAQRLSAALTQAGVSNTLEVFQGDHVNHSLERLSTRMLPWVSKQFASSK